MTFIRNNKHIHGLHCQPDKRKAGDMVISEGEETEYLYTIETGWAIEYRLLDDGRRQILNFILPGDCFGLQALSKKVADYSVCVVPDTDLRKISPSTFLKALKDKPQLAPDLWHASMKELAIMREQIVRIGRMSAIERIAHMLLELNARLSEYECVRNDRIDIKIPQALLADALGLSIVHVSRTMTKLQKLGYIKVTDRGIEILNRRDMSRMCDFEHDYLEVLDQKRVA